MHAADLSDFPRWRPGGCRRRARGFCRSTLLTSCLFSCLAGAFAAFGDDPPVTADPAVASASLSFERRPYDVRLLVAFDDREMDADGGRTMLREIDQAAQRCFGDLWSLKATAITWLEPVSARGIERIDGSAFAGRAPGETADIWFVAVIESRTGGTCVSVRSWQPEIQSVTAALSVEVVDERDVPMSLMRACRQLVRPMGVVEQVLDRSVRVRLRAGELSPADASFAQLAPGDLLRPMLALRNRQKIVEQLQSIPWTYISVDSIDGSSVNGTLQSGLKLALGGKKRGRTEMVVIAVRPEFASTRVELLTQSKSPLPLVAHRLEIRSEAMIPRSTEDHPDVDPSSTLLNEELTDRRGMARVSVQPARPLVWLLAFSGQHLLARVPFVPGLVAETRLEVPDDSARLMAEADLQMLQGEVIDAVALRNTGMAAIRLAAKKDDWNTVNQRLALLKRQQASSVLLDRLIEVRVSGTAAARARRDKPAEVRIGRMCDDVGALIKAHLGDDKVRLLAEEMDALQSPEADVAAPKKSSRI
jgi:hypothetical protein